MDLPVIRGICCSASVPVTNIPPVTTSVRREEEKIKPPASFKLKKAFAETAQSYDVSKPKSVGEQIVQVEAREAFGSEKVVAALDAYIRSHALETTVAIALKTHTPLVQGEDVVLEVDNKLQYEKVEAIKSSIQNALMKHLNNGHLSLELRFFDDTKGKEERRLITSQDKLEYFIKENPVVAEMKRMFGLEFE